MKVNELSKEQLAAELKKTIKVRAVGEPDIFVGYYNHLRRRGGDIFILRPVIRDRGIRIEDPVTKRMIMSRKKEKILITAEMQFSERWMTRVNTNAPETPPEHFNKIGRGNAKNKLNIPGMTNKVGVDDAAAMNQHDAGGDPIDDAGDITTQSALNAAGGGSKPQGPSVTEEVVI